MSTTKELIMHLHQIRFDDLKIEEIQSAKVALMHYFYCMSLGKDSEAYNKAKHLNELIADEMRTFPVFFQEEQASFFDSIFYNSLIAQTILHEDIHPPSNSHPGIVVIPASIITAYNKQSSGKNLIEAIISGYEAMSKVGLLTQSEQFNNRGFRPTAILGILGSVTAVSKLLNLNSNQLENAFSLAANMASGLNEWATEGTEDLYVQNGLAAKNGSFAAFLASKNVTSSQNILEAPKGYINAFGLNKDTTLLESNTLQINSVKYKLAPTCALIQSAATLAREVYKDDLPISDIKEIIIYTHHLGKNYPGCDYKGPFKSVLQARMSNQFLFASTLITGEINNRTFLNFDDPNINELSQKISVQIDDHINRQFPEKQAMKVEITFTNDSKKVYSVNDSVYLSEEQVINNFKSHFSNVLGKENAEKFYEKINRLEHESNLDEFINFLKGL